MITLKNTLVFLFIGLVSLSFAQDINEAGTSFNDGNEAFKAKKYAEAVKDYESSLDMCQMIGADAADLQSKVEAQLVNALYKNSLVLYKGKKFDDAVAELQKTVKAAKAADNNKIAQKATAYIPKVYSSEGMGMIKAKKYDDALAVFDKAFAVKPNCVKAFYGQALAYKGKEDIDAAIVSFDKAIEAGAGNPKAEKTLKKAKRIAQKMLEANAAKELQIEHTQKAIDYLNKSLDYANNSSNTYYLLALAYNKEKKFNDAVNAAKQAISLKEGDASDLQFVLGQAYEGNGDNANACAAYKAVVSGPNVEAAKFQVKEVLKCK